MLHKQPSIVQGAKNRSWGVGVRGDNRRRSDPVFACPCDVGGLKI